MDLFTTNANQSGSLYQNPYANQKTQEQKDAEEIAALLKDRPGFSGVTGPDGKLLDAYKLNASPYLDLLKGVNMDNGAYDALKKKALWDPATQGDSPWMKLMKEQSALQMQNALQNATQQGASSAAQARSALASRGGLSGGAALSLARSQARDLSRNQQDISRQNLMDLSNLGVKDEEMRNSMLGQVGSMDVSRFNAELGKQQGIANLGLQTDQFNLSNALKDLQNRNQFDMDKWKQQQELNASYRNARATESSGGCCFIFLEARYGNGTMDKVVRRFRDENMTERNKRGYYKLAEVLVPLMRKSKLAKFAVRTLMTDPMVSYGKYVYGQGRIGKLFAPVAKFWLKTFDFLGQDHPFLRENGELI